MGAIIFGRNLIVRGQFSGEHLFSGAIILGDNCPRCNYPGGNFSQGELSSGTIVQGAIFFGGNYRLGQLSGDNHPEGNYLGDYYPRGNFPQGQLS